MDRRGLRLKSVCGRSSKVRRESMWRDWSGGAPEFADSLPDVLAAADLRLVARTLLAARGRGASRILMYGGHVIKCGLGPLLSRWLETGLFDSLATNGAGSIHDLEAAVFGHTSEDVQAGLADGSFGMWEETAVLYGRAVDLAEGEALGLGEALGRIVEQEGPETGGSPLATALRLGRPVTVHPSLGADIVHPVPHVDWPRLAGAAERDFRLLGDRIAGLSGGVVINAGSAVMMPEVFLKLLTCARNAGSPAGGFLSVNMDMIQHYRPGVNVLGRPAAALGGRAVALTGHHELMLPLLDLVVRAEESRG
jgi:hypothetical protein